ncbi:hypothetical protein ACFLYU_02440 [Candidatus Dependentiae bacterium]
MTCILSKKYLLFFIVLASMAKFSFAMKLKGFEPVKSWDLGCKGIVAISESSRYIACANGLDLVVFDRKNKNKKIFSRKNQDKKLGNILCVAIDETFVGFGTKNGYVKVFNFKDKNTKKQGVFTYKLCVEYYEGIINLDIINGAVAFCDSYNLFVYNIKTGKTIKDFSWHVLQSRMPDCDMCSFYLLLFSRCGKKLFVSAPFEGVFLLDIASGEVKQLKMNFYDFLAFSNIYKDLFIFVKRSFISDSVLQLVFFDCKDMSQESFDVTGSCSSSALVFDEKREEMIFVCGVLPNSRRNCKVVTYTYNKKIRKLIRKFKKRDLHSLKKKLLKKARSKILTDVKIKTFFA